MTVLVQTVTVLVQTVTLLVLSVTVLVLITSDLPQDPANISPIQRRRGAEAGLSVGLAGGGMGAREGLGVVNVWLSGGLRPSANCWSLDGGWEIPGDQTTNDTDTWRPEDP